jgi:hypothetical protein
MKTNNLTKKFEEAKQNFLRNINENIEDKESHFNFEMLNSGNAIITYKTPEGKKIIKKLMNTKD